jgi:hypothetical protein
MGVRTVVDARCAPSFTLADVRPHFLLKEIEMRTRARRIETLAILAFACLLLLPSGAVAQSTIAGLVTDATGAVLPGVTVEAASPALIEKVRTIVTNTDGRYSIVDLRPGTYLVTFTLAGFSTTKREGIDVSANVTVPVNAEMRVGALGETIVVSGATPVVDIQQAAQRQVLSREVLDALPTARSYLSAGAIVPTVKLSRPGERTLVTMPWKSTAWTCGIRTA